MSDPNNGIYNTVLSYIPGTQQYTEASDHHVQNSSSASEEHHEVHQGGKGNTSTVGNASAVGNTGAGNTGTASAHGNRTGNHESQKALGGLNDNTVGNTFGSGGHTFPSGERASGGGLGVGNTSGIASQTQNQGSGGRTAEDRPSHLHSGQNTATGSDTPATDVNYGQNTAGSDVYNTSGKNVGATDGYNTSGKNTGATEGYNTSGKNTGATNAYNISEPGSGVKNQVFYEEDLADDTGTHHSGYKPDGSSQGTQTAHQEHNDGVRGAPIEGENVKGYAIGAPVGSGDTERPNHPGDPSGQVSGAHMEYLPQETDTRDSSGRGTVGKSQGTGDSSFANVKTKDDNGNSSHVISQTSTSHMSHSSVTQL